MPELCLKTLETELTDYYCYAVEKISLKRKMFEEIHCYIKKQTSRLKGINEKKHKKKLDECKKIKLEDKSTRKKHNPLNYSTNLNKNNLNLQSPNKSSNNQCNQCLQWFNPNKSCFCPPRTCNIKEIGNCSLQTDCCQPTCSPEFYSKKPAPYGLQVKVLNKPQPYVAFPQLCTPCISSTPCSTICPSPCSSPCPSPYPLPCPLSSPPTCPSPCSCPQPCPQVRVQPCQISSPLTRPSCLPCPSCPPCPPCLPCSPYRQPRLQLPSAHLPTLYTQQCKSLPLPCTSLCISQIPLSLPKTTLCPNYQVQCYNPNFQSRHYNPSSESRHRTSRSPKKFYKSSEKCAPCRCEKQRRHLLNANVPLNKIQQRTQKMKRNQQIQTATTVPTQFARPRQPPPKKFVQKKIQELQDKLKKGQPTKQIKFKKEVKDRASGMPLKQQQKGNTACTCSYQCFLLNSTKDGNEYQCFRTDVIPQNKALLDSLKKRQLKKFKDQKIPKNIPLVVHDLKMDNMSGNMQEIPFEPSYQNQTLDYPLELRRRNHPTSKHYSNSFKPKKHIRSFNSNLHRKPGKLMPYRSHSLPHVLSEPYGYSQMEIQKYPDETYYEYPEEVIENVYLDGENYEIFESFEADRPPFRSHTIPPRSYSVMNRRKRFRPNPRLMPIRQRGPHSFYSNQISRMMPKPLTGNRMYVNRPQPFNRQNPIYPLYGSQQDYEDEQIVVLDADIEDGGIYEFDYDMLQANNNYGDSSEMGDYQDYIDDYYYDDGCEDHIEEEEYAFDPEQYQCCPHHDYYYSYCDEIPYEVEEIILEDPRLTSPFNYFPCTPMGCCCCNSFPMPVTNICTLEDSPGLSEKSNDSVVNSDRIDEEVNKILKTNPIYLRLLEEKRENKIKAQVDKVLSTKTKIVSAVNAALMKNDLFNSDNHTCDCNTPMYSHSCCPCTNFQPHCANMNFCPPCPVLNPVTISSIYPAFPCPCQGQQVLMFPSSHDTSSSNSSSSHSSRCSAKRCCSRSKSCVSCRCCPPSIIPIPPSPSCFPITNQDINNWHCHNCPDWPPLDPYGSMTCCRPSFCNPLTRYYAKKAKKYRRICKRRPFKIIKNKDSNEILRKELECSDHKMNVIKELNKDICNLLAEKEKKEEEIRSMDVGNGDTDINAIKLEIARLKADYKLHHGKKKKKCLKDGEICVLGDASSED